MKEFVCPLCGKKFDSEKGLKIHRSKVHEAKKEKKERKKPKNLITSYKVVADKASAKIKILRDPKEYVPIYAIELPKISPATQAVLDKIRESLIREVRLRKEEMLDPRAAERVKKKFKQAASERLRKEIPKMRKEKVETLIGLLLHEMLGLGNIEFLLNDGNLEEIAINTSSEPIWTYHKKYGWLKTNIVLKSEEYIENLASSIGRKVGRQITTLNPLLDAHLITGDRVNATLFPITTKGNTITIRMFRREPWTITDLIKNNTTNLEVTSLLWLCTQYEISYLVSGGTSAGKTTFLNVLLPFVPANQRVISIEQTRELNLPKFLHWIPMVTREPNPEGRGGVTMLNLMINSLRMRPDRIVVGEVRRAREAEVLFEAARTGHSVYATIHADTANQTLKRLTTPPISLPEAAISAMPLVIVMFRDRRKGIRRVFQVSEVVPTAGARREKIRMNLIYRWRPRADKITKHTESIRLMDELKLHTGMTEEEIEADMEEKQEILKWMVKNNISTVDTVGKVVSSYYSDRDFVLDVIRKNKDRSKILGELSKELK